MPVGRQLRTRQALIRFGSAGMRRAWLNHVSAAALATTMLAHGVAPAVAETLREAMSAAYLSNPKLDAERATLRATDEEVSRAESGFRPYVQGSADIGRIDNKSTPASTTSGKAEPWGYSISVRQSVFSGFQTSSDVAEATAGVKAGRENLREVETQVLLEAVSSYMDVVRDLAILRIRENNVQVLSRELEAAQKRRSVREVTTTDVAQARARNARAISAADVAKSNLKISRATYERVIGHAPQSLSRAGLSIKQLPNSIEDAWHTAEMQSPSVNSALFREEAARYAVDKVRGELLPQVSVEANFDQREDPSAGYQETQSASISGRVSMPLYDGGEIRARVRQAKHTHVSRLQQIEQARSETQELVTASWSRMIAARGQLKADGVQVESNRIALDGVREEEKVGQRTLLDVLNAEQEFLDAQIELVTARRDLVVASYQLLANCGLLNAETLELGTDVYNPEAHFEENRENWFGIDITRADGRTEVFDAVDAESNPN